MTSHEVLESVAKGMVAAGLYKEMRKQRSELWP